MKRNNAEISIDDDDEEMFARVRGWVRKMNERKMNETMKNE